MNDMLNDYNVVKKCVYKGETYYVRDNGAVMRVPKDNNKYRKYDNEWTFGKPSKETGYMFIASHRVHRIVAYAFLGEPPSEDYVIDHIDTNRRNNRPENLRWVTRLDNVLNNPITRSKIEMICGSIEAFLENPSLLNGHENDDKNFSWMRSVTPEEARNSLKNWIEWTKKTTKPKGGTIDDWIYQDNPNFDVNFSLDESSKRNNLSDDWKEVQQNGISLLTKNNKPTAQTEKIIEKKEVQVKPLEVQSLTHNAIQINWKYPVLFTCCPDQFSGNPLAVYKANLKKGAVFCKNDYGKSYVLKSGMPQSDCLYVMCKIRIAYKTHAITKITFKEGIFYHENIGVYDFSDDPEDLFESLLNGESIK